MSTIDIKIKCPEKNKRRGKLGSSQIECRHSGFTASLRAISNYPEYKECNHKSNHFNIQKLKYGDEELKDANRSDKLELKHGINDISTYYSSKYDPDGDDEYIDKPLMLRIKYKNGKAYWYSNADADDNEQDGRPEEKPNTRWREIPGTENIYPKYSNESTTPFIQKLKHLTCQLYNLHRVDIYEKGPYNCPCGKTQVTVEQEDSVPRYTKYTYSYNVKPNSVKYDGTILKYRDPEDENDYQPIQVDTEIIKSLSVYYWDEDKGHNRPLIMEVYVGENSGDFGAMKVSLGNDGKPDNSEWSMILDNGEPKVLSGKKLEEKLQERKCRLFRPADINVSAKNGHYPNPYCKMEECPKNVQVNDYKDYVPFEFTARKHTYENGLPFTVTGFKSNHSEGESPVELTILDVTEVVVFSAKCNGGPLLVYVKSSDKSAKIHKWYSRTKGGEWAVESELKKPPQESYKEELESVLKGIKDKLGLHCQDENKPQPLPLIKPHIDPCSKVGIGDIASILVKSAKFGAVGSVVAGALTAAGVGIALGLANGLGDKTLAEKPEEVVPKTESEVTPPAETKQEEFESDESNELPEATEEIVVETSSTSVQRNEVDEPEALPGTEDKKREREDAQPTSLPRDSSGLPNNLSGSGGESWMNSIYTGFPSSSSTTYGGSVVYESYDREKYGDTYPYFSPDEMSSGGKIFKPKDLFFDAPKEPILKTYPVDITLRVPGEPASTNPVQSNKDNANPQGETTKTPSAGKGPSTTLPGPTGSAPNQGTEDTEVSPLLPVLPPLEETREPQPEEHEAEESTPKSIPVQSLPLQVGLPGLKTAPEVKGSDPTSSATTTAPTDATTLPTQTEIPESEIVKKESEKPDHSLSPDLQVAYIAPSEGPKPEEASGSHATAEPSEEPTPEPEALGDPVSGVYAKDLVWHPFNEAQKLKFQDDPPRPIHGDILLTKLAGGQELDLTAYLEKGIGKTHSKWSPVSTAVYRFKPEITFSEEFPLSKNEKEELCELCPMDVFSMKNGDICIEDTLSCTSCRACVERFPKSVIVKKLNNHIIFSIESTGAVPSATLLLRAIEVLKNKSIRLMNRISELG